jgi:hypothetical protein
MYDLDRLNAMDAPAAAVVSAEDGTHIEDM